MRDWLRKLDRLFLDVFEPPLSFARVAGWLVGSTIFVPGDKNCMNSILRSIRFSSVVKPCLDGLLEALFLSMETKIV